LRGFGISDVPGFIQEEVTRLDTIDRARQKYNTLYQYYINRSPTPTITPFVPPREITYRSPIAEEYYLGCGLYRIPMCGAIFRYRNYVAEFTFHTEAVEEGQVVGIKISQIEPILRAMDSQASVVLGR
jgi:hypothetical protein